MNLQFFMVFPNCCMLEVEIETQSSKGSKVTAGGIPLGINFHL